MPKTTSAPVSCALKTSTFANDTLFAIFKRLLWVVLFCGLVGFVLWGMGQRTTLDIQWVYALGTGVPIWFLTDVVRQWLFQSRGLTMKNSRLLWIYVALCIVLGFFIGTFLGDRYAGWSTFDLIDIAPRKFAALIIMCSSISVVFVLFFRQKHKLQLAQQQATQAQLRLLQSQLEPHMLFNTLANLRALIDLNPQQAQNMLDRLIDYLRATLGASRVTLHSLEREFARLEDYLALMHIRMGKRLHYQLNLPEPLKTLACPALLLQPVVENAVLHGLEPTPAGGTLTVSATQINQQLVLSVTDTGQTPAKNLSTQSLSSGFGLAQLRDRLQVLYGDAASLSLKAHQPCGVQVTITLPATPHVQTTASQP